MRIAYALGRKIYSNRLAMVNHAARRLGHVFVAEALSAAW